MLPRAHRCGLTAEADRALLLCPCDGYNQCYFCWAQSLDAPPCTGPTAAASDVVTTVSIAETCSYLLLQLLLTCSCRTPHYFRKLWPPAVGYSPSVVMARSRRRKTASLFHLPSSLCPVPPFARLLAEVCWQRSLGNVVFKLLALAVYRRVWKNKCGAESQR